MDTFIDLWRMWLEETPISDLQLWGHTVRWWGRWGKLIQLFSVITIVIDIIGPDAIRATGGRWRTIFNVRFVRQLLYGNIWLVRDIIRNTRSRNKPDQASQDAWAELIANTSKPFAAIFGTTLMVVLIINIIIWIIRIIPWLYDRGALAQIAIPFAFVFGPLLSLAVLFPVVLVVVLLISAACSAFGFLMLLLAILLEWNYVENFLKVLATMVFLVGFGLELLLY